MPEWRDERYVPRWRDQVGFVEDNFRFLFALTQSMSKAGCPDGTMGERLDWLVHELEELQLLRATKDGSLTEAVAQFVKMYRGIVKGSVPTDPVSMLDFALQQLNEYEAFKRHMREAKIPVLYMTVFPDDEPQAE